MIRRLLLLVLLLAPYLASAEAVTVASKNFTEAHILAEITAQLLESKGHTVERKLGLGGTLIAYQAILSREVDVYSDYTGTLIRAVLNQPELDRAGLDAVLASEGLIFRSEFGFNNSYAIAVTETLAKARSLHRVSDLRDHPDLVMSFSHEFISRGDGWPSMQALYDLPQQPSGIEHALAYRALASGHLDVTDAYTTDGDIGLYDLRLLEDDRGLFPVYDAGLLTRADMPAQVVDDLSLLKGRIDEPKMQAMNLRVASDGDSPADVAADFLKTEGLVLQAAPRQTRASRIAHNTYVHLQLTGSALGVACLIAVPLALLVSRRPKVASALQYGAGLVQTIPALALLALLIPILGLGQGTAVAALFLYSLLPIVRNTLAGIFSVDPLLKEVAASMGLTARQQILRIELPLALPMIIAGVKTAAVISIGTATLAAFVGAGGLGQPIITGLSLNDNDLILEGALPAAALAIAVEFLFEIVEKRFVPAYLRHQR